MMKPKLSADALFSRSWLSFLLCFTYICRVFFYNTVQYVQVLECVCACVCDGRNLLFLKDYDGDVSELGLDFTVANNDFGEAQVRH